MQRKFITNLIFLLFLNLTVKVYWILGIEVGVQNAVGSSEYGFYFAILNASFLFNIILDFGITNFNNRNISQHSHLLQKYFSNIVFLRLLLLVAYAVVVFGFGALVGYDERQMKFLALVGFNQFLLSFILYLRSNIAALQLFKVDSMLSVLDRFIMILICLVLLKTTFLGGSFKIEHFVYAQTSAYIISALIAFFIVLSKAGFQKISFNKAFFFMILKQALPFAILNFLMAFYNRSDSILLERLLPGDLGDHQAGLYATSFRLLDAVNMIAYLFSVLLLPLFSRMIKEKEKVYDLVKLSFTLIFLLSTTVWTITLNYSYDIMSTLYYGLPHEDVVYASKILPIVMSGFIAISSTYIFGTLLTANGSLKYLNIVALSGMLISLILNFILIPRMMAEGSAYASIIAQFTTAIAQVIIAIKVFKFKIKPKFLIQLGAYSVFVFAAGHYSSHLSSHWALNIMAIILFAVVFAFATRMFNIKMIFKLVFDKNFDKKLEN